MLIQKQNENKDIERYKVMLFVFDNEEVDFLQNSFTPVVIFRVVVLKVCGVVQKGNLAKHLALATHLQTDIYSDPYTRNWSYIYIPRRCSRNEGDYA